MGWRNVLSQKKKKKDPLQEDSSRPIEEEVEEEKMASHLHANVVLAPRPQLVFARELWPSSKPIKPQPPISSL